MPPKDFKSFDEERDLTFCAEWRFFEIHLIIAFCLLPVIIIFLPLFISLFCIDYFLFTLLPSGIGYFFSSFYVECRPMTPEE